MRVPVNMRQSFTFRSSDLPYREAVGVVACNPQGLVLVGQALGYKNIWKMPQGGLERDEDPEQAARRELREEAGIGQAELVRKSDGRHAYEYPEGSRYMPGFRGQEFAWFLFRVPENVSLDPCKFAPPEEGPEFADLRWVTPAEAIARAHNAEGGDAVTFQGQNMYRQVLKEFGLWKPGSDRLLQPSSPL